MVQVAPLLAKRQVTPSAASLPGRLNPELKLSVPSSTPQWKLLTSPPRYSHSTHRSPVRDWSPRTEHGALLKPPPGPTTSRFPVPPTLAIYCERSCPSTVASCVAVSGTAASIVSSSQSLQTVEYPVRVTPT